LAKLQADGVIEKNLFEWAEALRITGNEAAHGVGTQILRADCEDILEFTEALAQYVFTYQDRFTRFKSRQVRKSNSATGTDDKDAPF
jgi:hypothetical protein